MVEYENEALDFTSHQVWKLSGALHIPSRAPQRSPSRRRVLPSYHPSSLLAIHRYLPESTLPYHPYRRSRQATDANYYCTTYIHRSPCPPRERLTLCGSSEDGGERRRRGEVQVGRGYTYIPGLMWSDIEETDYHHVRYPPNNAIWWWGG